MDDKLGQLSTVLGSLFNLLPESVTSISCKRIPTSRLKKAYVSKMMKVCYDSDRWSLSYCWETRGATGTSSSSSSSTR